jgi:hypothetical protein
MTPENQLLILRHRFSSQDFAEKLVDTFSRLQTMGLISFDEWWKVFQEVMEKEIESIENVHPQKD